MRNVACAIIILAVTVSAMGNGVILGMTSLLVASDPYNSLFASFHFNYSDRPEVVTLSENKERVSIVLEDQNEEDCLIVGEVIGGNLITPIMYNMWVSLGKPDCWCCPCHFRGDVNCDNAVTFSDVVGTDGIGGSIWDGWIDSWNLQYHPCSDINNDGIVSFADVIGTVGQTDGWLNGWDYGCP